jgi:hypothetical protein
MVTPPRMRNPAIPAAIDEIVMRALRADVGTRYQRAEELLNDILEARHEIRPAPPPLPREPAMAARPVVPRAVTPRPPTGRLRTRQVASGRFCWNCRKPLPARSGRCPFCDEPQ